MSVSATGPSDTASAMELAVGDDDDAASMQSDIAEVKRMQHVIAAAHTEFRPTNAAGAAAAAAPTQSYFGGGGSAKAVDQQSYGSGIQLTPLPQPSSSAAGRSDDAGKDSTPLLRKREEGGADGGSSSGGGGSSGSGAGAGGWTLDGVMQSLKAIDLFPKAEENVQLDSSTGPATSLITLVIITLLVVSQISDYFTVKVRHQMSVDTQRPGEQLPIFVDFTMHRVPCSRASLDVMDVTGRDLGDVHQGLRRQRLSRAGAPIGAPMTGSEDPPDGPTEGCRITGTVSVNKVVGNMHVAIGRVEKGADGKHVHLFEPEDLRAYNSSHTIHALRFGEAFAYQADPLAGTSVASEQAGPVHHKYFVKVVPTTFTRASGSQLSSHQYSVTNVSVVTSADNPRQGSGIPGVFIVYDFSPVRVRVTEVSMPFTSFLVQLCAIAGGVVTIAGLIDALLYHALRLKQEHAPNLAPAISGALQSFAKG